MGKGLKMTVVGPMKQELLKLQKDHDAFLKKSQKEKKAPASLAAFVMIPSPIFPVSWFGEAESKESSSLAMRAATKSCKDWSSLRLLPENGNMQVDILKVPHHGSDRNMETIFFERVKANHYVFSGNGENGIPERKR